MNMTWYGFIKTSEKIIATRQGQQLDLVAEDLVKGLNAAIENVYNPELAGGLIFEIVPNEELRMYLARTSRDNNG
jgi:hypothetical protein